MVSKKYLPSGVGGLGFLGCSGGFLGFIDSSISFSLSAAAFSFISKSFRLFSTLIFSLVANSLKEKSVISRTYKNLGLEPSNLTLTVFYLAWPDLFAGSSLQNVLVLGVLSVAMFQSQSQFHPVLCLSAVARVSVINVTKVSRGQFYFGQDDLDRFLTWIIETTLHNLSLGNLFMSSDSFRFSS